MANFTDLHVGQVGVLVCEWASPHVDETYAGSAFWSFVLETGEHPYLMQTLHTTVEYGVPVVVTTSKVLSVGDAFVFDRTTPHMAAPKYSSSDQLLVMLQIELRDGSEEERRRLLELVPPLGVDEDDGSVIGS